MKKKIFIRKDEDGVSPVIATILMVAITVVLAAVLYIMVIGLTPTTGTQTPQGQFSTIDVQSNTTAEAIFAKLTNDPAVTKLKVVLEIGLTSGTYSFGSAETGTIANLDDGSDLGTITYRDFVDNEKVNSGDKLLMSDLTTSSDYTIYLIWAPDGAIIDQAEFTTSS